MYLLCISVQYIKGLCLSGLGVLWCLVVLSALRVLSLNLPRVLCLERVLIVCILCLSVFVSLLEVLLMFAVPVFFCILANVTIWSPSTLLWFRFCCTGGWLICFLGFNLYGWFRICGGHSVAGRGNWPIFPQFIKIARHFHYLRPRITSMNKGIF